MKDRSKKFGFSPNNSLAKANKNNVYSLPHALKGVVIKITELS
jgi:hypothetical protein